METGTSGGIAAKRQAKRILVPRPSQRRFYGYGIPGVDVNKLAGKLISNRSLPLLAPAEFWPTTSCRGTNNVAARATAALAATPGRSA